MRPVEDSGESYYAAVERFFVERRGSPLFISPGEWHLVWQWEQQGIPLHVVRDGIDRVFERPRARQRPRKLSYCRQTVEAGYRRFREAALGARAPSSPADERSEIASHLSKLVSELRAASHAETALRVETLMDEELDLVELESRLGALEEELLTSAEKRLGEEARSELLGDARASLESYRERMPQKVYDSALESAYRRRLRRARGIPRLSILDR